MNRQALGETMSCKEFVELVTDYLEGRMGSAEAERFDAHMEVCPPCRYYLDQMRSTLDALGRSRRSRCPTPRATSSCTRSATGTRTAPTAEAQLGGERATRPSPSRAAAFASRGYFSFSELKTPAWSES